MQNAYTKQTNPVTIPTNDDKSIVEHFGLASTGDAGVSIARMVAPPGWGEPHQTPEFDEYILMISGKKQVEIEGEVVVLEAGESMKVVKGKRVRYSNPFEEPAEYWCICVPAFSLDTVHREAE